MQEVKTLKPSSESLLILQTLQPTLFHFMLGIVMYSVKVFANSAAFQEVNFIRQYFPFLINLGMQSFLETIQIKSKQIIVQKL